MVYLKIIKCSEPHMWYANKVGMTLPLVREDDYYWAREDAGYINIILKKDAIKISPDGGESPCLFIYEMDTNNK